MRTLFRVLSLSLLASLALALAGCASDDDADRPKGPNDDTSALPWNRPMPGERSGGPLGSMPFQSR